MTVAHSPWQDLQSGTPPSLLNPNSVGSGVGLLSFFFFCDFYRKYLWNGSTQRKSALSTTYPPIFGELWSTDKKLIGVNVDPPKWTLFRKLYLGRYGVLSPEIFYTRHKPTTPKLYFQSDLRCRAASSWALPHISCYFLSLYLYLAPLC